MMCFKKVVFPVPAFPVRNTFLLVLLMNLEAMFAEALVSDIFKIITLRIYVFLSGRFGNNRIKLK